MKKLLISFLLFSFILLTPALAETDVTDCIYTEGLNEAINCYENILKAYDSGNLDYMRTYLSIEYLSWTKSRVYPTEKLDDLDLSGFTEKKGKEKVHILSKVELGKNPSGNEKYDIETEYPGIKPLIEIDENRYECVFRGKVTVYSNIEDERNGVGGVDGYSYSCDYDYTPIISYVKETTLPNGMAYQINIALPELMLHVIESKDEVLQENGTDIIKFENLKYYSSPFFQLSFKDKEPVFQFKDRQEVRKAVENSFPLLNWVCEKSEKVEYVNKWRFPSDIHNELKYLFGYRKDKENIINNEQEYSDPSWATPLKEEVETDNCYMKIEEKVENGVLKSYVEYTLVPPKEQWEKTTQTIWDYSKSLAGLTEGELKTRGFDKLNPLISLFKEGTWAIKIYDNSGSKFEATLYLEDKNLKKVEDVFNENAEHKVKISSDKLYKVFADFDKGYIRQQPQKSSTLSRLLQAFVSSVSVNLNFMFSGGLAVEPATDLPGILFSTQNMLDFLKGF